jgi:hypothetical protein
MESSNLMSNSDPTEQQLKSLMIEVAQAVKQRAELADAKFKEILTENIEKISNKYNK